MKSSPANWQYIVSVKSSVKNLSNFLAFLDNTNFNSQSQQFHLSIQNISQRMVNQSVQFDELKVEKHRKIGIILKESLKNSQL